MNVNLGDKQNKSDEVETEQKESGERAQQTFNMERRQWSLCFPREASASNAKKSADDSSSVGSSGYVPSSGSDCSFSPISFSEDSSLFEDDPEECKIPAHSMSNVTFFLPSNLFALEKHGTDLASSHDRKVLVKKKKAVFSGKSSFLTLGPDPMTQLLKFLEPTEILRILTLPLCKEWRRSYTSHQTLWKGLCVSKPFSAKLGREPDDDFLGDDSGKLFSTDAFEPATDKVLGQYRMMYTSFVRCQKYLSRLTDDARNGRTPSAIDYGRGCFPSFSVSKAQGKRRKHQSRTSLKRPKYGNSMITSRLLGPSQDAKPSHLTLPKSCGIYSIVNWMVAYPDVVGIQTICVEAFPYLLEDETQRMTAKREVIVEIIIQAMLRFPDCLKLHTAGFHSMVLLARPLGGREGMLFDNSMVEASSHIGLVGNTTSSATGRAGAVSVDRSSSSRLDGINGISIMIDSMRRFESDETLQAMACWAMVNIALASAQKTMLISLGGIQAIIDTMIRHPRCFDVQFRALFALINLVVLSPNPKPLYPQANCVEGKTEKDALDEHMPQIVNLVVVAMKNFWSSEKIINRACLVLNNLSHTADFLPTLLWTPHCHHMLEWSIANYPTDHVLCRSATTTLRRLQRFLSENDSMRERFEASILRERDSCIQNSVAQQFG